MLSWTMHKFVHSPKPYLLLSTSCDKILSWMIEFWMKIYNTKSKTPPKIFFLQGMTSNFGLTFSVGDTT